MQWTRRRFLSMGAVAATVGLAGCQDDGNNPVLTQSPTPESLSAQLSVVRQATEQYQGSEGLNRALSADFRPYGRVGNTFVLHGDAVRRTELHRRNVTGLIYVIDDVESSPRLGAVTYNIVPEDHRRAGDHTPPNLFNDEPRELPISEADAWRQFHSHPLGTVLNAFSNQDGAETDDIGSIPYTDLLLSENWRMFIGNDQYADIEAGDSLDVDDDGVAEVLDFVFRQQTSWDLAVWIHLDNANGVFASRYSPNGEN